MPETAPPTRRRWFRFGLRSLLVFTALVGLLMGWIVKERRQSAREMEIAETLERAGWQLDIGGPFDVVDSLEKPRLQGWWRKALHSLLGSRILGATDFPEQHGRFELFEQLVSLKVLRMYSLVKDVAPIANHRCLRDVALYNLNTDDLTPLSKLKQLRKFNFVGHVSDLQLQELRTTLPQCRIAQMDY